MELKTELIVRHYECDAYGHVNNANYLNYLEHARGEFLKSIGFDYKGFMADGYGIYIVRVNITYKSPAFPDDKLEIFTSSGERKRATGTFIQKVMNNGTLICEAEVTWASIGKDGRMSPIPEKWDVSGLHPESR